MSFWKRHTCACPLCGDAALYALNYHWSKFFERGAAMPGRAARLATYIPLLAIARGYRSDDLPHDLMAGLVVAVVAVPQGMAYAYLAGLPPEVGLYASLAPLVVYAVLGSSRQMMVGPVAIAALMVAATVSGHAPAYSQRYADIAVVLSAQVGVFLLLLRLGRLGGLARLLSHPVVGGFVNAAAILILVSQLAAMVGVGAGPGANLGAQTAALVQALPGLNPVAVAVGTASLGLLWIVRRHTATLVPKLGNGHPLSRAGPMVVAVCATAATALFGLNLDTVGTVPAGLPTFGAPLFDLALWRDLAPNAALIALVAFVESYSVGKTLAARELRRINGNQELIALGAANMSAAFSGAYPVAGSFGRSSINRAVGARTPVSALVCAAAVAATLLWLTPLFTHLPKAALAAIVIAAVWELLDFRALRHHWRFHRPDAATHLATFAGVLVLGVEGGLLVGVAVSLALLLRASSDPHIAILGRVGKTPHFRNVARYETRTWPHLVAMRVDESMHFANADQIETRLAAATRDAAVRHLVLVMSAVNFVDVSGLEMLRRLTAQLENADVSLHLCEVKGPLRDQLEHADLADWLTGRVFQTTDDAFNALIDEAGRWVWRPDAATPP